MAAHAIEVGDLSKRFGDVGALDNVSFAVEYGEAFGYLGPNGAGKTTTIRCMLGLVRPSSGALRILGFDVAKDLRPALADIGYLPGELGLWPSMTGAEILDYLGALQKRAPSGRAALIERFQFSKADLDRQVRFYSRGMKQKIGIIQAFQHAPQLVVLDEPTEGLDPLMKERFAELLAEHRAGGGTVFLSSHILSEVESATDRVAILRDGSLIRVGPTEGLTGDHVRHCTLTLKDPARSGLLDLPGVSELTGGGTRFRFDFRGDMAPLMRRLAPAGVDEFLCEPERLTESFFEIFGETA